MTSVFLWVVIDQTSLISSLQSKTHKLLSLPLSVLAPRGTYNGTWAEDFVKMGSQTLNIDGDDKAVVAREKESGMWGCFGSALVLSNGFKW